MFKRPETFILTQMDNFIDEIPRLGKENPDYYMKIAELLEHYTYGDYIFRYQFPDDLPVALIDEPDNESDPKAIRVELNGIPVGYIKKTRTGRVRNILKEPDIKIRATVSGGQCRIVTMYESGKTFVMGFDTGFEIKVIFYKELS